jgi:spore germination cell wall hydrolase CwlJ-like protein
MKKILVFILLLATLTYDRPVNANPSNLSSDTLVVLQTLILESVGDGFDSMTAVAEVIRNRAKTFQKSYKDVCLMPSQFSGWNDKQRAAEFLKKHEEYLEVAYRAWLASAKSDLNYGATDYHTLNIHPYWADGYRTVATIGSHIFYCRN